MGYEQDERLLARPYTVQTTDDAGSFEGHGAIFGDMHPTSSWTLGPEWKDRIQPGAFKRTLEAHTRAGTLPAMLFMHERGNVVGAWREMGEVGAGLHTRGQVALDARTSSGASLHGLMKMGALNALSIGFRVRKDERDQDKKVREILEVELSEVSIVDVPGIHRARITDVKFLGDPRNAENLERLLRELGLSRGEAKGLLAKGFRALREAEASGDPDLREAGGDDGSNGGSGLREAGGDDGEFLADLKSFAASLNS